MKPVYLILMFVCALALAAQPVLPVTLPYAEDFESSSNLPSGWSVHVSSEGSIDVYPFEGHDGPQCLYYWANSAPEGQIMLAAGPVINSDDFSGNSASVWAKGYSEGEYAGFSIGFLGTIGDPASFTALDTWTLTGSYVQYVTPLEMVRTDTQIAFKFIPSDTYQGCFLDDVEIGMVSVETVDLPYTQNFDDSEDWPEGWSAIRDPDDWSTGSIDVYYDGYSAPYAVYFWSSTDPENINTMMLVGPRVADEDLDGLRVEFMGKGYSEGEYPSVTVGWLGDIGNVETFSPIQSFLLTGNYLTYSAEIGVVRSDSWIAFRFDPLSSEQGAHIDDVYLGYESQPGITLPYSEDFEEAWYPNLPSPWYGIVQPEGGYSSVGLCDYMGYNSAQSLNLYYSTEPIEQLTLAAIGPMISESDCTSETSLSLYCYSIYDEVAPEVRVGLITNPSDMETFTTLGLIEPGDTWTQYNMDLGSAPIRSNSYLAIVVDPSGNYQEVYIDDIEIGDGGSTPTDDLPFTEEFNIFGFPNGGWTETLLNNGTGPGYDPDWTASIQSSSPACMPYAGDAMALFMNARAGGMSRLATPELSVANTHALRVEFWMIHSSELNYPPYDQEGMQLQVSTDGENWTDIGAFMYRVDPAASSPFWRKHVFDISAYAGETQLQVGLVGLTMNGQKQYVDEFAILESRVGTDGVLISEVSDNLPGQPETTGYIELVNRTSCNLDIGGLKVRAGTADPQGQNFLPDDPEVSYTIPDGTVIQRNGGIVVIGAGADEAAFRSVWGITGSLSYLPGSVTLPITNDQSYDLYNPVVRAGTLDATPVVPNGTSAVQNTDDNWSATTPAAATPSTLSPEQTLPVELSSFTASVTAGESVLLCWETASESDLLGFRVLRNDVDDLSSALDICPVIIPGQNASNGHLYFYEDGSLPETECLYYWLRSFSLDGTTDIHGPAMVTLGGGDGEQDVPEICTSTALKGNYPNPFNPSTIIQFDLAGDEGSTIPVSLQVFNVRGQLVRNLITGVCPAGKGHRVVWDGTDNNGKPVASGFYLYRLQTPMIRSVRKALLVK